jgi:tetratricopeptide (TPR) repeat protein
LLSVDDSFGDAYLLRARLLFLVPRDHEDALDAATLAVKSFRDDKQKRSEALVLRATLRSLLSQDPELIESDLDAAIDADPENVDAWKTRAAHFITGGQIEKAVEDFKKVLSQDPENIAVRLTLADQLRELEQLEEAKAQVNRAVELKPEEPANYIIRAQIFEAEENVEQALADLTKALELDEQNLEARLERARMYLMSEKLDEAKRDVDQVLKLNPDSAGGTYLRSTISAALGNFQEAIADIQRLLRGNPQNVGLLLQLASYYVADQRPRKAIELLDSVISRDENNAQALRARGDALLGVGKHVEAVEDYEKALKLQPEDDGVLNNLAWVLATSPKDELRDGKRSIELATKACEVTNYEKPHILSTLAAGYAETGDFENAIKWSKKAVELGEEDLPEQIEQLQQELESYEQGKPWRELQNIEERPDPPRNIIET